MKKNELFGNIHVSKGSIEPDLVDDSMTTKFEAISRIVGNSFYVLDFYKKEFAYISANPLFLCGYTLDEVKKLGFSFFEKIMLPEDYQKFTEINDSGVDVFRSYPAETRRKFVLSIDTRLVHPHNRLIYVNFEITPFVTSAEGGLWLSVGLVSLTSKKKSVQGYITNEDAAERYEYSLESKKWKLGESFLLSPREKEILLYSAQGFTNQQIAASLFIDVNTVKFHKRKVFEKFDVKNIIEAISFAYKYKLI